MKKKSRVLGGRKAKRKGGRVERGLVKFLKERGILSARRTAQCNGKSEFSECDVIAPKELPHFHLESKGTANPYVGEKLLFEWLSQLKADCKVGRIPIIFHKANHRAWTCIISEEIRLELNIPRASVMLRVGETFTPSHCTLYTSTEFPANPHIGRILAVKVGNDFVYAMDAFELLSYMIIYEDNLTSGNGISGGRSENGSNFSCGGTSLCSKGNLQASDLCSDEASPLSAAEKLAGRLRRDLPESGD